VIFGNVGAAKKAGLHGNRRWRKTWRRALESENKVFKTHIIISESTLEELGEAAAGESVRVGGGERQDGGGADLRAEVSGRGAGSSGEQCAFWGLNRRAMKPPPQ